MPRDWLRFGLFTWRLLLFRVRCWFWSFRVWRWFFVLRVLCLPAFGVGPSRRVRWFRFWTLLVGVWFVVVLRLGFGLFRVRWFRIGFSLFGAARWSTRAKIWKYEW